jgi:hypothetical protein
MFSSAQGKLEDSRSIFEQLKMASDALSFRALFNAFIQASRAIMEALKKDGSHIVGFKDWHKIKYQKMLDDELLLFIHEARREDFHEGKHRLNFQSHIQGPARLEPFPKESLSITDEGPFRIVDEGTPRERRIPIKQDVNYVTQVSIANAPIVHRGKKLAKNDPLTICQLALDYFSELVYEAKTKFAPQ